MTFDPRYVTPSLSVWDRPELPVMPLNDALAYLDEPWAGPLVVYSWAEAYRILRALGLSADDARHRINFARTGDMYATRTAARRQQQRPARLGG